MTIHDPSAPSSADTTRRFRLRGLRRRPRPAGANKARSDARANDRDRRRLAAIDRKLATEAPQLVSMFTMFNRLTVGEGTVAAEQLPPPARPRRTRLRSAHVAVLFMLAAVIALFFALSTQLHTVARPCGTSVTPAMAAQAAAHATDCSAYATNK